MSISTIILASIFTTLLILGLVYLLKPKEKNNKVSENTISQASAPRIDKEEKKFIGVVPHFG
jgi:hypothetical protein|uniref:Uncharacterized protein n=1 Tax=viral metagenome TaxID=1070528 RepID=A0A6C0J1J0_9ZZZZ